MERAIHIHSQATILITFHFNLGFCLEFCDQERRNAVLKRVAERLGGSMSGWRWSAVPNPPMPRTLVSGGSTLQGHWEGESGCQSIAAAALATVEGLSLAGPVQESMEYLDHGMGSVQLSIPVRLAEPGQIPALFAVSTEICNAIQERLEVLALSREWVAFRVAFRAALEADRALFDMWGILSRGGQGRDFTATVTFNFLFRAAPSGAEADGLALPEAEIPTLFAPLTGLEGGDVVHLLPNHPDVPWLTEGWDGQVVILASDAAERWLRYLWSYSFNCWTALSDLDAFLYEEIRSLGRNHRVTLREARQMMSAIRRVEQSVAVLAHEANPAHVWDSTEQISVHRGIYDNWEQEALMAQVREKLSFMTGHYDNLNSILSGFFQDRMNVVMTVFTFLTFAGVMADVISSVDFEGSSLSTAWRLYLIVLGTGGVVVVAGFISRFYQQRDLEQA